MSPPDTWNSALVFHLDTFRRIKGFHGTFSLVVFQVLLAIYSIENT